MIGDFLAKVEGEYGKGCGDSGRVQEKKACAKFLKDLNVTIKRETEVEAFRKEGSAEVITAIPLSKKAQKSVERVLSELAGEGVTIKMSVDPTLLGGIFVRIGEQIIDVSIRGQLDRLKEGIYKEILAHEGISR